MKPTDMTRCNEFVHRKNDSHGACNRKATVQYRWWDPAKNGALAHFGKCAEHAEHVEKRLRDQGYRFERLTWVPA